MCESGVSRTTNINFLPSGKVTSAARAIRSSQNPIRIAAKVFMLPGSRLGGGLRSTECFENLARMPNKTLPWSDDHVIVQKQVTRGTRCHVVNVVARLREFADLAGEEEECQPEMTWRARRQPLKLTSLAVISVSYFKVAIPHLPKMTCVSIPNSRRI